MYKIKVAWGISNSIVAFNDDPNGELNLTKFDGSPLYNEYEFDTLEEIKGFKFAVSEMEGYLNGYIVDKNE